MCFWRTSERVYDFFYALVEYSPVSLPQAIFLYREVVRLPAVLMVAVMFFKQATLFNACLNCAAVAAPSLSEDVCHSCFRGKSKDRKVRQKFDDTPLTRFT